MCESFEGKNPKTTICVVTVMTACYSVQVGSIDAVIPNLRHHTILASLMCHKLNKSAFVSYFANVCYEINGMHH